MITEIENAVGDYLREILTASATLVAGTWEVKPVTSTSPWAENKVKVAVKIRDIAKPFPRLAEGMVEIYVSTPAEPAAIAATATLFEQSVERAFSTIDSPTVEADIATKLTERLPDWSGGGIAVSGWQPGREDSNFNPHFALKVGLVRN